MVRFPHRSARSKRPACSRSRPRYAGTNFTETCYATADDEDGFTTAAASPRIWMSLTFASAICMLTTIKGPLFPRCSCVRAERISRALASARATNASPRWWCFNPVHLIAIRVRLDVCLLAIFLYRGKCPVAGTRYATFWHSCSDITKY